MSGSTKPAMPAAAIVVGAYGQDGTLLTQNLLKANIPVVRVGNGDCDLLNSKEAERLFEAGPVRHDIYFLAAIHQSSESRTKDTLDADLKKSLNLHANAPAVLLELIRKRNVGDRFFYASSSRIFGIPRDSPQNESTPRRPGCVYGITKELGMKVCDLFRRNHGVFACSGILYNHESPLRKLPFLSKKIVRAAVAKRRGKAHKVSLQNIAAQVDWSCAGDIVQAMRLAMNGDEPMDFVMASGKSHSVEEFAKIAFDEVRLDWADSIEWAKGPEVPENQRLIGDTALLKEMTGWEPSVTFEQMVRRLVQAELNANA